ncbi:hypothetical protein RHE_CH01032 [Rhizobium etli CFN 42]|uniref:Uncharacterized protein n=1 Tax=Rhizobium etli (strain ATCC 51251 / DSM 11541 / JCM 21823 / NBRC 15573 / CFN 42) TaxID=347834 RepID=Q2KBE5_RHIEC|nr:hypothetical protein [Rhizobium etli]ABC89841.1 hypothetical protein RHE_CH01032 [Rhizobium etli CFN 42]
MIRPPARAGRIGFQIVTLAVPIIAFGAARAILLCGEALQAETGSAGAPITMRKMHAATLAGMPANKRFERRRQSESRDAQHSRSSPPPARLCYPDLSHSLSLPSLSSS